MGFTKKIYIKFQIKKRKKIKKGFKNALNDYFINKSTWKIKNQIQSK